MAISVSCPSCQKTMDFPDVSAGTRQKCPSCGNLVAVPGLSPLSAPRETPLSLADELKKLGELRERGIIDENEFRQMKSRLTGIQSSATAVIKANQPDTPEEVRVVDYKCPKCGVAGKTFEEYGSRLICKKCGNRWIFRAPPLRLAVNSTPGPSPLGPTVHPSTEITPSSPEDNEGGKPNATASKGFTNGCIGCTIAVVIFVILFLWAAESANPRRDTYTKSWKDNFSSWDGSHRNFVKEYKSKMHDPSSFEHVETKYIDNADGTLTIIMTCRGKNAFGGKVVNRVIGKVSKESGTVFSMEIAD